MVPFFFPGVAGRKLVSILYRFTYPCWIFGKGLFYVPNKTIGFSQPLDGLWRLTHTALNFTYDVQVHCQDRFVFPRLYGYCRTGAVAMAG